MQRAAMRLRELDYSTAEIAKLVGVRTPDAIRMRLHRWRRRTGKPSPCRRMPRADRGVVSLDAIGGF